MASFFFHGAVFYGDGSGVLAKVVSASGNVLTVDKVNNVIEGMVVDVISNSGKTPVVSARRIVDVDRAGKKVTLGGSAISEVSADDFLTVQGSYNRELTGLGAIFGDSETLYGLTRASNKWLTPYKKTSQDITDITIQTAIDVLDEVAGSAADFIVCSGGVKRAYQEYLITKSRAPSLDRRQGGSRKGQSGKIRLSVRHEP